MTYYCSCYEFKFSTTDTAYAPLEIGSVITCQLCYRHNSWVVLCIPQGVAVVPAFKVLGISI